jgi:thiopurine S-methyltransferase
MDGDFWRGRWRDNAIGFHQPAANPLLTRNFPALGLEAGARIFVPLCGKSLDLGWLLGQGFRVAGAELVETAVEQLFAELGREPTIRKLGRLTHYSSDGIDVFAGDAFDLSAEMLGRVDATYDRAALVALPETLRPRYAAHVIAIAEGAPQILVSFDYDQSLTDGPPFSVDAEEVRALYSGAYDVALVESVEVTLKGTCPAKEQVWRLARKTFHAGHAGT